MTSHGTITTPELEAGNAFEHSAALDALQNNLDTSLTLNRKKSGWFGSAREAVARGALQAKGYVDSLRGSSPVKREHEYDVPHHDTENISNEEHSFSPRRAINTFRQHVHISGSRTRQRRGALADIHGNIAHGGDTNGPEIYTQSEDPVASPTGHGKKLSLGRNLVGSIRTLTSKHTRSPPRMGDKENLPPASVAVSSSPRVPLTLDLGSSLELLPQGFGRATTSTSDEESPAMARPASTLISPNAGPPVNQLDNMAEEETDTSVVESILESILETEASGEDPSEMFERSVDTKCKPLKRMISLDAMAERCIQSPDRKSPKELVISKQCSATTVSTCPNDMQEITRQAARVQMPTVLLDGQADGKWRSDDPFAPGTPSIRLHGPETVLPFRPKAVPHEPEEEQIETSDNQKTISSAAKHRSMVSEVLEMVNSVGEIEFATVFNVRDSERESALHGPVFGNAVSDSGTQSCKGSNEDALQGSHDAAFGESAECETDVETTLQDVILDNYDLQVALGGVDITCDDQPLHWAGQEEDLQEDQIQQEECQEAFQEEVTRDSCIQGKCSAEEESDSSTCRKSGTASPDYEVLLGSDALSISVSATKIHDYEALLEQIGSDTSGESISELSQDGVGSLKEAIDMYRSYSAEHAAGEPLAPVASDASNRPVMRKPVPSRYRVRH